MLLDFTFDPLRHKYHVEGHFCLATSDIVALCGIRDLRGIPSETLDAAAKRGTRLHKAIEDYEQGRDWQAGFPEEYMPYLEGYFAFRDDYEIQVVPPMEKLYAYLHDCDVAVGCTIDQRFIYQGALFINDVKSNCRVYRKALQQLQLEWRLQTASYKVASEFDEVFMHSLKVGSVKRSVLHLHPKYPKKYEFYIFEQDDDELWRGAVLMAMEKTAAGIVPPERETGFQEQLKASLEETYVE